MLTLGLVAAPSPALAQGSGADLSVTKTSEGLGGDNTILYTVTVEANGPSNATNVQLSDTTPPELSFVSVTSPPGWLCISPAPGGDGTITCSTSSLAPGSVATFTILMRLKATVLTGDVVTNTATVDAVTPDPLPGNNSSSYTFIVAGSSRDSAGVYDPSTGAWFLKNTNAAGGADLVFSFGPGGTAVPIKGDWNGDGIDTVGVYIPSSGAFFLKNTNSGGGADIIFTYGPAGAGFVPIAGDWDGDGDDTVGLYDPATGAFFLKNTNAGGGADLVFTFGPAGAGFVPIAGDWDGDNDDTIGLYDPATAAFFLKNTNSGGAADTVFTFGPTFATPVVGDWNSDAFGVDTIGVYVSASTAWFLRNTNTAGPADVVFNYGPTGFVGIAGDWDGL